MSVHTEIICQRIHNFVTTHSISKQQELRNCPDWITVWLPISESEAAQHKTSTAAEGKSLKDFATCCYDAEERGGKLSKILGVRKHELGASFGKGRPPPAAGVTPSENFGLKSCTFVHFRHQNVLFTMTLVYFSTARSIF